MHFPPAVLGLLQSLYMRGEVIRKQAKKERWQGLRTSGAAPLPRRWLYGGMGGRRRRICRRRLEIEIECNARRVTSRAGESESVARGWKEAKNGGEATAVAGGMVGCRVAARLVQGEQVVTP